MHAGNRLDDSGQETSLQDFQLDPVYMRVGTDGHLTGSRIRPTKSKVQQNARQNIQNGAHPANAVSPVPDSDSEVGSLSGRGSPQKKQPSGSEPCCFTVQKVFKKFISTKKRLVSLSGECSPASSFDNRVQNRKSNILTFLPLFLYNQFKAFFNLFFLAITLSQFYPPLQVGFFITYISPLALVLFLSMTKEIFDEYSRWAKDKKFNSEPFSKVTTSGIASVESAALSCGDIVKLSRDSDSNGVVFIKTDQLDGETDWKVREAVTFTQRLVNQRDKDFAALLQCGGSITADPPSKEIYEFKGSFESSPAGDDFEALRLKNTMWANTVLASGEALGIVIYTGKETRMQMNARNPRTKSGKTDDEINKLSMLLFGFVFVLATIILALSGKWYQTKWYIFFFKNILLLSSIIPISLRVNIDFAKIVYCMKLAKDERLEGTIVRNTSIPEELGRLEYLLTDKTGTLTKNEMIFKRLSTMVSNFTRENLEDLKELVISDIESNPTVGSWTAAKKKGKYKLVRDLISALMVCHNVTPVDDGGDRVLQAASPDEVALVQFAESLGYHLESRDIKTIKILNLKGGLEEFEVLENFPFTSERKRMGILVRDTKTGGIIFYLKGADAIMIPKLSSVEGSFVAEECENLAKEGLRTLVMAQRMISAEGYAQWKLKFAEASRDLQNREEAENQVIEQLEANMELLGVSGVEDLLQDDIKRVIENLRAGGIKIWMLTGRKALLTSGDKLETAKCIAISTGLKSQKEEFLEVKPMPLAAFVSFMEDYGRNPTQVLIVEGSTLKSIMNSKVQRKVFIKNAANAPSVVCCRCAPTQKSEITEAIKNGLQKVVCSIGDGGNDVGMIQMASIGVGIEGKEGKQAALAADFSIKQFKTLAPLVLWSGRLSYVRTSQLANFVIHRGLIISIIQFLFSMTFNFTTIQIYNGYLMLGYATIFTSLPVFALIYDEDVDYRQVFDYPQLYKALQSSKQLGTSKFLMWAWMSIYQGGVIIFLAIVLFQESFLEIVTITFTALILIEFLNIISTIHIFHPMILMGLLTGAITYLVTLFFLQDLFLLSEVTYNFMGKVGIIVAAAWLPIRIGLLIQTTYYPSLLNKIRREARRQKRLLSKNLPDDDNTSQKLLE